MQLPSFHTHIIIVQELSKLMIILFLLLYQHLLLFLLYGNLIITYLHAIVIVAATIMLVGNGLKRRRAKSYFSLFLEYFALFKGIEQESVSQSSARSDASATVKVDKLSANGAEFPQRNHHSSVHHISLTFCIGLALRNANLAIVRLRWFKIHERKRKRFKRAEMFNENCHDPMSNWRQFTSCF